eukprot:UN27764
MTARKYEKNTRIKEVIASKIKLYLDRAEIIKENLGEGYVPQKFLPNKNKTQPDGCRRGLNKHEAIRLDELIKDRDNRNRELCKIALNEIIFPQFTWKIIIDFTLDLEHPPSEHCLGKCVTYETTTGITFEDVYGHKCIKDKLKETIILPMLFPQLFLVVDHGDFNPLCFVDHRAQEKLCWFGQPWVN